MARDKTSLDIFWLKDKSLTDLDNLPEPDELSCGNHREPGGRSRQLPSSAGRTRITVAEGKCLVNALQISLGHSDKEA